MLDSEELIQIESEMKTLYAGRDSLIKEMRDLRFMRGTPETPAGLDADIVQAPLGYQVVENMVGTITANDAHISVPPAAVTEVAQNRSSQIERWLKAANDQMCQQQDEDIIERFTECLVAEGHACLRILYAPQLWKGFPKREKKEEDSTYNERTEGWKKGRPIPIATTWLDPCCVFPVWGEDGMKAVLEVDTRDIQTLKQERFNLTKSNPDLWDLARNKLGDTGEVKFYQFWTEDSLVYGVNGVIVHEQRNKLGYVPYIYALGNAVASRDPGIMGLSVLYPIRSLLPYKDRLLTQIASAVKLWAWPTPVFTESPQPTGIEQVVGEEGKGRNVRVVPGKLVQLYGGETLNWLGPPPSYVDLGQLNQEISSLIERASIPSMALGANSGDSGYAINQLIAAARTKLKPLVSHAERAIERMFRTWLDIIERQIKQTVYVYDRGKKSGPAGWIGLGPDDIQGYRYIKVTLNPILPTDAYARSSKAINEVNAGLKSRWRAMEDIGEEQPEEEMTRIAVDQFMAEPEVRDAVKKAAIKKFGLDIEQTSEMAMKELFEIAPRLPIALQEAIKAVLLGQQGQMQPGMPQGEQGPPMTEGGMPIGPPPNTLGPNVGGMPMTQVMAQPNVQAVPNTPMPNAVAQAAGQQIGQAHLGPVTRPAGVAQGMPYGTGMPPNQGGA